MAALQTAKSYPSTHRLADFASLAMNIGPVLGIQFEEVKQLLDGMDSEKADFTLEHNPLFPLLVTWLEKGGMEERESIDSKTLFDEMRNQIPYGSSFTYKNAGVLSHKLNNLKTELAGWVDVKRFSGANNKTLWQIYPGAKLVWTPKEKQNDPSC